MIEKIIYFEICVNLIEVPLKLLQKARFRKFSKKKRQKSNTKSYLRILYHIISQTIKYL